MREVCAVCDDPKRPRRLPWVLPMYCDYYVARCADTCFVAADADGGAVGYILCAPDYAAYRRDFRSSGVWKQVFSQNALQAVFWLFRPMAESRFARDYPAHLHIDILPAYQRMGVGHRLMDALFSELRRRGIPGVMLGCAASNEKGRSFYRKMGFSELFSLPGAVYYGMQL